MKYFGPKIALAKYLESFEKSQYEIRSNEIRIRQGSLVLVPTKFSFSHSLFNFK